MVVRVKCHSCHRTGLYGNNSLRWEQEPEDAAVYWVDCRFCGKETGSTAELAPLISRVPDWEPDPDNEYEKYYETITHNS